MTMTPRKKLLWQDLHVLTPTYGTTNCNKIYFAYDCKSTHNWEKNVLHYNLRIALRALGYKILSIDNVWADDVVVKKLFLTDVPKEIYETTAKQFSDWIHDLNTDMRLDDTDSDDDVASIDSVDEDPDNI